MANIVRFVLWTAVIVGAIGALFRFTMLREWRVPSNDPVLEASIMPTLRAGDLVLLYRLGDPVTGDLVMCPEPGAPGRVVVGRIAAEPGDKVVLEKGHAEVNGRKFKIERVCDPKDITVPHPDDGSDVSQACMWEDMGSTLHMTATVSGHNPPRDYRQVIVPEDHVFLLSDNRLFPYDSRDFGPVERSTCKERPMFRVVSRKGWMDSEGRFAFLQ